jgi:hypothetical protein
MEMLVLQEILVTGQPEEMRELLVPLDMERALEVMVRQEITEALEIQEMLVLQEIMVMEQLLAEQDQQEQQVIAI